MPDAQTDSTQFARWRMAPTLSLIATYILMLALSWRQWADPIVDYGRELYQAWRLAEGAELYTDVASLFGPLPSVINGLWCRWFGASLMSLASLQLILIALVTAMLYRYFAPSVGRLASTLAGMVFLVCFAFVHGMIDMANYNFVCPYTHSATYGLILLIAATWAMARGLEQDTLLAWLLAGIALGGAFLTKPEHGLAAFALLAFAIIWRSLNRNSSPRSATPGIALLIGGFILLPLLFAITMGPDAVVHAWLATSKMDLSQSAFYAEITGLDQPLVNIGKALADAGLWAGVAMIAIWAEQRLANASPAIKTLARMSIFAAVGLLLIRDPLNSARGLPILCFMAITWLCIRTWRMRNKDPLEARRQVRLVLWAALSLALLPKIILSARLGWYGFYLGLPGCLLLIVLAVGEAPRLLERGGKGWLVRPIAVMAVGLFLALTIIRSQLAYSVRNKLLGEGPNMLSVHDPDSPPGHRNGGLMIHAQIVIERLATDGETLAVIPEGALLNVLTARPNTTPYDVLLPPEMTVFGENEIEAAYRENPPDHVLILNRPFAEYGVGPFGGETWAPWLPAWLEADYEPIYHEDEISCAWNFTLYRRRR